MAKDYDDIQYAKNFAGLLTGGMYVTMPLFVLEYADRRCRGRLMVMYLVCKYVGQIAQSALFRLTIKSGALPTYFICTWFQFLFVMLWYYTPDTPLQLLRKNKYEEAKASYVYYNMGNRMPMEGSADVARLNRAMEHLADFVEAGRALRQRMHPLRLIFSAQGLRGIFIFLAIYAMLHYGGMIAMLYRFYAVDHDQNEEYSLHCLQFLSTIVCAWQIDRVPRVRLVWCTSLCILFSSSAMGAVAKLTDHFPQHTHRLAQVNTLLLLLYATSTTVVYVVAYVLVTEIFDSRVRELCFSIVCLFIGLTNYVSMLMFCVVDAYAGRAYAMWLRSMFCALGIIVAFCMPETLCKDVHDSAQYRLERDVPGEEKPARLVWESLLTLRMSSTTENPNVVTAERDASATGSDQSNANTRA